MTYAKIIATGSYLPERIMSNAELSTFLDTSDEWIRSRSGIEERRLAASDESTSDLAYHAAYNALEQSPITAQDLDMILVATSTPDHIFPSVASTLQHRLACRDIAAFDLQAVCAGFLYALITAEQFIRAGMIRTALIVGAETFSHIVDWHDRRTAILFGDGAGAVVLQASDEAGIVARVMHCDGAYKDMLYVPYGAGNAAHSEASPYIQMQGGEVFKISVKKMSALVEELLAQAQMRSEDIDFLIPHQANERIIHAIAHSLHLPEDKVILTIAKHANTSAASVPLALDAGIRQGRIHAGDTLLLEAFGGGFVWAGTIVRY